MNKKSEKMEDCPKFEKCSAPLCPLAKETEGMLWFADEEICTEKTNTVIARQKTIKAKTPKKERENVCYMVKNNHIYKFKNKDDD